MTSDSRTHHQKSSLLRFVSNYLALLVIYIGETPKYFIDLLKFLNIFLFLVNELGKSPTTVSREIRSHTITKNVGSPGCPYNNCKHRFSCTSSFLCKECGFRRFRSHCNQCKLCNSVCSRYVPDSCRLLGKPPYVCNGCPKRNRSCTLQKHLYDPVSAQKQYEEKLSEARSGISLTEDDIAHLNGIVSPLLKKKQSLHHICVNHPDSVMVSESTMYRLIDYGLFDAKNIDLPRKVRYARRKRKKVYKVDKSCRLGRTYADYQLYIREHPDLPVTQIDSVEGRKGGKILLTIHFVKAEFMLAYLRDHNDSQSVIDVFEQLYFALRPDRFMSLMPVLLGDNGSEFSNPKALESDRQGNHRTKVFYCDASAPHQKGSAERNHEFIRMFIPKGTPMDDFSQDDISVMMNHINSYGRSSLGDKSPYEVMEFLYGPEILKLLGCTRISPDDVTLSPSVFKKEGEQK
ncbi:IS30 family transposase [Suilimivivens sp.]|uniref:IS30 family transposase n=1 Tax=Suilimivivens sp. TaxID=2981669 RepID=UPI00307BC944